MFGLRINKFGSNNAYEAAAAWTPAQLSSLALWLDADDASTITLNGSTVSQWDDKSGNDRHATQSVSASQPTYDATGFNGKPAVTWSDNFDNMQTPSFSAQSFYFAMRYSDGSQATWINFQGLFGGDNAPIGLISAGGGTNTWYIGNVFRNIRRDGGSEVDTNVGGVVALPIPNGTISASALSPETPPSTWRIGNDRAISGRGWIGPMAEVIATPTLLSDTDRQKLEGYLAWKWGGI